MTNEDLKRFYNNNPIDNPEDFVRYDKNINIKVADNPTAKDAVNKDYVDKQIAAIEAGNINL